MRIIGASTGVRSAPALIPVQCQRCWPWWSALGHSPYARPGDRAPGGGADVAGLRRARCADGGAARHRAQRHPGDAAERRLRGYLLKDRVLDVADFLAAAERVAGGGSALDPKVVASLIAPVNGGPLTRLSERERDVLDLVAQGLSNVAIATRLTLSERTVEAHVRHILTKLDIAEGQDGHRRVLAVLAYLSDMNARDEVQR